MANISQIPPLLSVTPPPIDDNEDDTNLPDWSDEFGKFSSEDDNVSNLSCLPTPDDIDVDATSANAFNNYMTVNTPPPLENINKNQKYKNKIPIQTELVEAVNKNFSGKYLEDIHNNNNFTISNLEYTEGIDSSHIDEYKNDYRKISTERKAELGKEMDSYCCSTLDINEKIEKEETEISEKIKSISVKDSSNNEILAVNRNETVILEDIIDDSSDDDTQNSNRFHLTDETSADFFKIHIINGETKKSTHTLKEPGSDTITNRQTNQTKVTGFSHDPNNYKDKLSDFPSIKTVVNEYEVDESNDAAFNDFQSTETTNANSETIVSDEDFNDFQSTIPVMNNIFSEIINTAQNTREKSLKTTTDESVAFEEFQSPKIAEFQFAKATTDLPTEETDNIFAFEADFSGQFTDSQQTDNWAETSAQLTLIKEPVDENSDTKSLSDDFDDFQDFSQQTSEKTQEITDDLGKLNINTKPSGNDDGEVDDDDDFGDFSDAPTHTNEILSDHQTTVNLMALDGRLKPILEMMFPKSVLNAKNETEENAISVMSDIGLKPIESAYALGCQWISSEVRHSMIHSLGIDSRNIQFGNNWNPSMPRYAANLSLNPLQPIKSQNFSGQLQENLNKNNTLTDVPAVEFSWNKSETVDPLDGTKDSQQQSLSKIELVQSSNFGGIQNKQNESNATSIAQKQDNYTNDTIYTESNTTTTPSTTIDTAATTTLSSTILSDSDGDTFNNIQQFPHHIDISATYTNTVNSLAIETAKSGQLPMLTDSLYKKTGSLSLENNFMSPNLPSINVETSTFKNNFANDIDDDDDDDDEDDEDDDNDSEILDVVDESNENGNEDADIIDEVVTTSTYAGPLKETHIYTPSKGDAATSFQTKTIPTTIIQTTTTTYPIDFDYKIAAAGIIIDETVVKKEYRDVEYNPPGFNLEFNKDADRFAVNSPKSIIFNSNSANKTVDNENYNQVGNDDDDEFSDFQSVPAPNTLSTAPHMSYPRITPNASPISNKKLKDLQGSRTATPTFGDEMILSPAILLPQAIPLENKTPKIEWGETTANINPDELARIEELFSQPKVNKAKELSNTQTNSPQHINPNQQTTQHKQLSISATIAHKEQQLQVNNNRNLTNDDDDEWSDFVSVPALATPQLTNIKLNANNAIIKNTSQTNNSSLNDDEWSDFQSVSTTAINNFTAPQFGSATWQNANFYNNPLSFYQKRHTQANVVPTNKMYNNINNNQYLPNTMQQQQHQLQSQQIYMMTDFSTAPAVTYQQTYRNNTIENKTKSNFSASPAKIAPSISLIPDLGFVAPINSTHSNFVQSLPKKTNFMTTASKK